MLLFFGQNTKVDLFANIYLSVKGQRCPYDGENYSLSAFFKDDENFGATPLCQDI